MRVWGAWFRRDTCPRNRSLATAVAAVLNGHCNGEILIHLLGGDLKIEWGQRDEPCIYDRSGSHFFRGRDQSVEYLNTNQTRKEEKIMFQVNDNFQKLPGSYLFSTIAKKSVHISGKIRTRT